MNSAGEERYDPAFDDDGRGLTRYVERAEGAPHDTFPFDQWNSSHYSAPANTGRYGSLVSANGALSTSPPLHGGSSKYGVPNHPQFYQYPQSVGPGSLHLWVPHYTRPSLADPLSLFPFSPASVVNASAPLRQGSPIYAPASPLIYTPGHNFGLQAAQNHFSLSPSSAYPTVPLSLTNNPNQYRIYPHGPPAPIHPEINTQWRQHSSNSSHSFPQTQVHSNFQFANAGTITQAEEVIQELDSNYVSSQYENYSSSSSLDQNVPHSIGMIVSSENPNHLPILDNKFDGNDNTRLPSPQNGFSEFSICFNDGVNSDTHATTTFAVNGSQYIGAPTRTRARSLKLEEIPFAARPWFLPPGAPTESHRKALRNVGRIPKQVYELFYREISGKIFCNYCRGGRSALQNRLEEHVNVHVGFRPYICSTCKKAYSRKENHNRDHPFEPELNFG